MTLINIHNVAIDNHFCCVLVAYENYVLNANILVFMLIHTELFSNVSGLVNIPVTDLHDCVVQLHFHHSRVAYSAISTRLKRRQMKTR